MPFSPHVLFTLLALASPIVADPVDWVSVAYACDKSRPHPDTTENARDKIMQRANSTAKNGPWSVTGNTDPTIVPSSGDRRDYMSWAPYHWPMCNWCKSGSANKSGGKVHLVHNGTDNTPSSSSTPNDSGANDDGEENDDDNYQDESVDKTSEFPVVYHRMSRKRRTIGDTAVPSVVNVPGPQAPLGGALPSVSVPVLSLQLTASPTTTANAVADTSAHPQAAAKTTAKAKASSCTPSPTKTMPPSATWTTCPYEVKDGRINPDVRTLNGPAAINDASQSILDNAIACAQTDSTDSADHYKSVVVSFIQAFFLDQSKGMNPNMNFGQVIRGPGKSGQEGTFTGILDMRGMVKVCNAVAILRALDKSHQYWTTDIDQAMRNWTTKYVDWLTTSDLGKSTASKANNHCTFYFVQRAAMKFFVGDKTGARQDLDYYFNNTFLEQIAANGEQPLEAVRTRPFHYRCFNLEAMIASAAVRWFLGANCVPQTAAKLGDELDANYWTAKSKYGATIQTAVDFVMSQAPKVKNEDTTECAPHVAAAAAVYKDKKYVEFLKNNAPSYQTQSFWFYDQQGAFPNAAAAQKPRRDESNASLTTVPVDWCLCDEFPGACEMVDGKQVVVLDNGIYAKCEDLRELYGVERDVPVVE